MSAKILLVDDDMMVLGATKQMIAKLGYEVVAVKGGLEALAEARKDPEAIDVVLLDMMMPGMNGPETFHELRALDPRMRIVLFSGFVSAESVRDLMDLGAISFLQKPFSGETLANTLREALEQ